MAPITLSQPSESRHRTQNSANGIYVRDLNFGYSERRLFSGLSFVSQEPRVVIKGPSGCGKTTLLRILHGSLAPANSPNLHLPKFPTSVLVLQEDALFPWLTGLRNITLLLKDMPLETIQAHALYRIVRPFINNPAYTMSYGQRRSIELFRAILYLPSVLFLDEPFNFLDDSRADSFISALLDISSTTQLVLTTHRHDHSLDKASAVFEFNGDPPYSNLLKGQS